VPAAAAAASTALAVRSRRVLAAMRGPTGDAGRQTGHQVCQDGALGEGGGAGGIGWSSCLGGSGHEEQAGHCPVAQRLWQRIAGRAWQRGGGGGVCKQSAWIDSRMAPVNKDARCVFFLTAHIHCQNTILSTCVKWSCGSVCSCSDVWAHHMCAEGLGVPGCCHACHWCSGRAC
jgi:hypothetical protein